MYREALHGILALVSIRAARFLGLGFFLSLCFKSSKSHSLTAGHYAIYRFKYI